MPKIYSGVVQQGSKRGQALGFPTANIPLDDPGVSGIYAGRAVLGGKEYPAAIFADQERNILETHILDFGGDLYGQKITVILEKKVRDVQRFDNDGALLVAIAGDITAVRRHFNST